MAISDDSSYSSKDSELLAAIWLSIICFIIEFSGLFLGISLFLARYNTFSILAHFAGCVLLSWYIIDTWYYSTFWYIWIFFSLFPTILEIVAFIRVFCLKVVQY